MDGYTKFIRQIKINGLNSQKGCYICNKYESICELHHLVEVSYISKVVKAFPDTQLYEMIKGIWLCPNHHTIFHKLLCNNSYETLVILDDEEIEKYERLYEFSLELYNNLKQLIFEAEIKKEDKAELMRDIQNKIITIRYVIKKLQNKSNQAST